MKNCKISVIIPFYNEEKYIIECIKAVTNQSLPKEHYEIIFVDNNSSDKSAKIVSAFSNIRLFSENKKGSYCARNLGIQQAKGEYIAFTDADCAPDRDWLKNMYNNLSFEKVIVGSRVSKQKSYFLKLIDKYENAKSEYIFNSHNPEIYFGQTSNMGIPKHFLKKFGGFCEILRGADLVFTNKVVTEYSTEAVCYLPEIKVYHLEIINFWSYCRKVFIYAKSRTNYQKLCFTRPLNYREKIFIAKQLLKKEKPITIPIFIILLVVGQCAWILGTAVSFIGQYYCSLKTNN